MMKIKTLQGAAMSQKNARIYKLYLTTKMVKNMRILIHNETRPG